MRLLVLLPLAAVPGCSQFISFGAIGGVQLTDSYTNVPVGNGGSSHSNDRYVVGPTFEFHLPLHLSLEVDALYRRSGFSINGFYVGFANVAVNDWQFPFLVKYEMPAGLIRPFLNAGIVYRRLSESPASNGILQPVAGLQNPNGAGFAIGGGVGFKIRRLRVSPQVRYVHWEQTAFNNEAVVSSNGQADFLASITF
jgi:hypothetical protein